MGDGPRVIMCVLMMFTLVLVPTSVFTTGGGSEDYSESHGPGRHLSSYDDAPAVSSILLLLSLVCRVSLAWLCLGWFVSHSVPGALAMASRQYTSFWKHSREGSAMKHKVRAVHCPSGGGWEVVTVVKSCDVVYFHRGSTARLLCSITMLWPL